MTRAIVAQRQLAMTGGIPSRVEVGHAEDIENGELELHIFAPSRVLSEERLIVEAGDPPPKPKPRGGFVSIDPLLRFKVSHQAVHQLEELVSTGLYGATVSDVARELLYLQLRREYLDRASAGLLDRIEYSSAPSPAGFLPGGSFEVFSVTRGERVAVKTPSSKKRPKPKPKKRKPKRARRGSR